MSGFHPFVIRAMGSDALVEPEQYNYIKILTKYVLRKTDLITCHGENLPERIAELGAKREKIKIIGLEIHQAGTENMSEMLEGDELLHGT